MGGETEGFKGMPQGNGCRPYSQIDGLPRDLKVHGMSPATPPGQRNHVDSRRRPSNPPLHPGWMQIPVSNFIGRIGLISETTRPSCAVESSTARGG